MSEIIIVELKNLSRDLQERGLLVSSETVDKAVERLAEAEAFIAEHKCGTCGGIRVKESELCSCHQACVTAATYPVIADGCFTGDTITIEITDDGDTP